jgi:hypothetical protein
MSQTARSESTNEYKHEPHTPPVLRAHVAELHWIRSIPEKKSLHGANTQKRLARPACRALGDFTILPTG